MPVELTPVGGDHPPLDFTPPPPGMPAGAPAIQPRLPTAIGKPGFTPDDVLAYLPQHPHPDADRSAPPATVESIEFLPSRDVARKLQTSVGRPDDALLCLVTLRGSFLVHGPYGITFDGQLGYLVFDAQTGNILIEGVGQ